MHVQVRLRWLLLVGLVGCLAISASLWGFRTDLPLFPLLPFPKGLATSFNGIGLVTFFVSLAFVLKSPERGLAYAGLVVSLGLLVVTDLTRWQPWIYHFALTGLLLAFFSQDPERDSKLEWFSLWLLVAIYVWSGWHKLHFDSGQSIVLVLVATFPTAWQVFLWPQWGAVLGIIAGVLELLFGVLLCFGRTRRIAIVCLSTMHLWIVVSLFAMGHDLSVIPWNLFCMGLLWWLAWSCPRTLWSLPWAVTVDNTSEEPNPCQSGALRVLVFLWIGLLGVVPFLHTWSLTGANASFALYSGNYVYTQLLIPNAIFRQLPKAVQPYARPVVRVPLRQKSSRIERWVTLHMVDLHSWSLQRFRTTVPPTRFYFSRVHQTLCRRWNKRPLLLIVRGKKVWGKGPKMFEIHSCSGHGKRAKWPASPP